MTAPESLELLPNTNAQEDALVLSSNVKKSYDWRIQLQQLQEWVREQQKIYPPK